MFRIHLTACCVPCYVLTVKCNTKTASKFQTKYCKLYSIY